MSFLAADGGGHAGWLRRAAVLQGVPAKYGNQPTMTSAPAGVSAAKVGGAPAGGVAGASINRCPVSEIVNRIGCMVVGVSGGDVEESCTAPKICAPVSVPATIVSGWAASACDAHTA